MQSDKKNKGANILCVLLKEIGDVVCDIPLSEGDVYDALEFLNTSN
jgi:3-dehydroquinate synthetase